MLKKIAEKYEGTTVGYKLVDADGVVRFYITDGGTGDTKWNLHEGDSPLVGLVDAYPTLKAAVAAANA